MTSEGNNNCVICSSSTVVADSTGSENESGCIEPYPSLSPEGNFLEDPSTVVFILRNVFELDQNQVENYKQKWGSPGSWLKLCGSCEEDVSNLQKIFLKLQEVKREFERTKWDIQEKVQVAEKEENKMKSGWEEILDECRNRVVHFRPKLNSPHSEENPTPNDLVVKEDEEDNQSFLEEEVKEEEDNQSFLEEEEGADNSIYPDAPTDPVDEKNCISIQPDLSNSMDAIEDVLRSLHTGDGSQSKSVSSIGGGDERYKCMTCGKICVTKGRLRQHMKYLGHKGSCVISASEALETTSDPTRSQNSVCTWGGCGRTFKDYRYLHKHIKLVHKRKYLKTCSICGQTCINSVGMTLHMRNVHPEPTTTSPKGHNADNKRVRCTWEGCTQTLKDVDSLKFHIKRCHEQSTKSVSNSGGGDKRYKCMTCGQVFTTIGHLSQHMWHLGHSESCEISATEAASNKPLACTWEGCGKTYKDHRDLRKHIKRVHERVYQRTCSLCGTTCLTKTDMTRHMTNVHPECDTQNNDNTNPDCEQSIKRVRCTWDGCTQTLKNLNSLKWHIKRFHERASEKTCFLCFLKLFDNRSLKHHMASIHGVGEVKIQNQKQVICDLCGKKFSGSKNLKTHIQVCHDKIPLTSRECDICHKYFPYKSSIDLHKARVHKIGDFKCDRDGCSKVFCKQEQLEAHIKYTHEGLVDPNTKYCQFCGKGYADISKLNIHEEYHRNIETRPFVCPVPECNKAFPTKRHCGLHASKVHAANKSRSRAQKRKNGSDSSASSPPVNAKDDPT